MEERGKGGEREGRREGMEERGKGGEREGRREGREERGIEQRGGKRKRKV